MVDCLNTGRIVVLLEIRYVNYWSSRLICVIIGAVRRSEYGLYREQR